MPPLDIIWATYNVTIVIDLNLLIFKTLETNGKVGLVGAVKLTVPDLKMLSSTILQAIY